MINGREGVHLMEYAHWCLSAMHQFGGNVSSLDNVECTLAMKANR